MHLGLIELDYWYGIKEALEKLGSTVFIAKVPAFGDIKSRAVSLDKFINKGMQESTTKRVQIFNIQRSEPRSNNFENKNEPIKST